MKRPFFSINRQRFDRSKLSAFDNVVFRLIKKVLPVKEIDIEVTFTQKGTVASCKAVKQANQTH